MRKGYRCGKYALISPISIIKISCSTPLLNTITATSLSQDAVVLKIKKWQFADYFRDLGFSSFFTRLFNLSSCLKCTMFFFHCAVSEIPVPEE
jgi:hypothetical protein